MAYPPHTWESIFSGNSYLAVYRVWGVEAGTWYGITVLTKWLLQGISRELHTTWPLPFCLLCIPIYAVPYSRHEPKAKCYCLFSVRPPDWTFCSPKVKLSPHLSSIESIVLSCTSSHWTMAKINICFWSVRVQYNQHFQSSLWAEFLFFFFHIAFWNSILLASKLTRISF